MYSSRRSLDGVGSQRDLRSTTEGQPERRSHHRDWAAWRTRWLTAWKSLTSFSTEAQVVALDGHPGP
jgi:hypothetical protein